ncbi:MAG TPA: hypothetical protein PK129_15075, partial [Cellvibrionaceae bacterium]|nr:hypothetical protein [Cellvibrionaceae bacterium]
INVWLLQKDVIEAETAAVSDNKKQCYLKRDPIFHPGSKESLRLINQEKKCVKQVAAAFARYQKLRQAFNAKWQPALQKAINLGDQVAEVIWRQCTTTSILDRSALASTCDNDPQRRKEATQRLEEIGFEAAIDRNPHLDIPQDKLREQNQVITIHQMESGVYGNWTIYDSTGSNGANSPEKLEEIRRFAVIDAALTLVRRSFTYVRGQAGNEYESHAKLQLNRRPLGTPELAWNANVFHHGSLYTGRYDPARNGFKVYLHYDNFREITVGGNRDTQYLRMLYDTLTRSEQRIDDWLQRDPRWAVFLLNRRGHHEWVPERMKSTFGQISKKWEGDWVLNKKFLNFKLATNKTTARLKIRKKKTQTIVQFEEATAPSYVCELRYSGASSYRPAADYDISAAARGFLGHLPDIAPISPFDKGPIEPFTPMNPREVYPQVLIQCPQGEWPDNRTSRFFFLSNAAIIEVKKIDGSGDLIMLHWTRSKVANKTVIHNSLPPPFEFKTTLAKLAHAVKAAENTD